jgi:hypothetical protein
MAEENYLLRGTRNTLLDMLLEPIGGTYPLFDLPVKAVNGVVFYNTAAEVVVSNSQPEVLYSIFEDINNPGEEQHTDTEDIVFKTGLLKEKVHAFRVKATKAYPPKASSILLQTAYIRVGVDRDLNVIAEKDTLNYGDRAALIVKKAQKGAKYSIIYYYKASGDVPVSDLMEIKDGDIVEKTRYPADKSTGTIEMIGAHVSAKLLGNDADLRLETTYGLKENMELRVAVEDEDTGLSGILLQTAAFNVMPHLNLPVAWFSKNSKVQTNNTNAADYRGTVGLRLGNTQKSVKYQLKLNEIDWDGPTPAPSDLLSDWIAGNGETVNIFVNIPAREDMVVVILAKKLTPGSPTAQLTAHVIIPVYPDPDKKLSVVSPAAPDDNHKAVRVDLLQRGILYQLRSPETKEMIGLPVFYHRNYGIGHTRVSADVIERRYKNEEAGLRASSLLIKSLFVVDFCNPKNEPEKDVALLPVAHFVGTALFEVIATKSTTGFSVIIGTVTVSE